MNPHFNTSLVWAIIYLDPVTGKTNNNKITHPYKSSTRFTFVHLILTVSSLLKFFLGLSILLQFSSSCVSLLCSIIIQSSCFVLFLAQHVLFLVVIVCDYHDVQIVLLHTSFSKFLLLLTFPQVAFQISLLSIV